MSAVTAGIRGDGSSFDHFLHSHVLSSSSMYFHFFMLCLPRPIFVPSLLRHFHSNQVPDAPLAKDSQGVCIILWGIYCRWLEYRLIRRMDGLSISLSVSCMKLLFDFRRSFGTMWPCSRCLVSFMCSHSLSLCRTTSHCGSGSDTC